MLDSQEHLVWTPIGWIEASAAVAFRPYRALDRNTGSEWPPKLTPVWGVRVAVSAIPDKTHSKGKEDHCRPTNITWYVFHRDGSGLLQGYMHLFCLAATAHGPVSQRVIWAIFG